MTNCDDGSERINDNERSVLNYMISIPIDGIFLIIIIMILIGWIYKTKTKQISSKIKIGANILLIIGLFIMIIEIWTTIFDLYYNNIHKNNVYCTIMLFFRLNGYIWFEIILYIFWLIRLKHTFYNSVLAFTNLFYYSFLGILSFIGMLLSAIYFIGIKNDNPCSLQLNNNDMYQCHINRDEPVTYILLIGTQIMSIILNIYFGVYFYVKLKALGIYNILY